MLKNKIRKMNSYSQSGEDMIVHFIFECLGIKNPSYLDIGANDPYRFSNTAFFYENGSRGINIDANPICVEKFKKKRRKDINLNLGIGTNKVDCLTFYIMNISTMSTFSKESAIELETNHGMKIEAEIKIDMMTINEIIEKYCNNKFPDFLSLDAEGLDFDILKSIDYEKSLPKVICVETLEYGTGIMNFDERKEKDIIDFLIGKGYMVFADTGINTIFLKR